MNNYNHFCPYCLIVNKQNIKCGICGQVTITISHRARVPKRNAKRKEWEQLFNEFPHILKSAPYTKLLGKMGFKERE